MFDDAATTLHQSEAIQLRKRGFKMSLMTRRALFISP